MFSEAKRHDSWQLGVMTSSLFQIIKASHYIRISNQRH
jgi:hypothetical protein